MFGPLTHDELSAICRLQYSNLSDVLTYGVKLGDTHPGGVQVLMWLWSQLFGTSAIAIRLPFVLMGIATLPLVYAIGRRWYGEWSALLPLAVMAVSQYTVYYSVLARPYCAGLFFVLCALYVLTLMVREDRFSLPRIALFAVFEACCAYTHYFCSLTALLMACGALFFVGRRHMLRYLAACIGAVLLFAPHLGITLYQLFEYKGVGGWLGAPTPVFALDFLQYLTHHSLPAALVAVAAYALLFRRASVRRHWKLMVAALAVGLLPMVIGYVYSVAVNPLLQFSGLVFAFPFFLLALAGGVSEKPWGWRTAAITAVYVLVKVTTLFFTRRHFVMLQKEWVQAAVELAHDARSRYGNDRVACLFGLSPDKVEYYDSSLHIMPPEVMSDAARLDSALAHCDAPYIATAGIMDPTIMHLVHQHYPSLLQVRPCVVAEACLFGRQVSDKTIDIDALATFNVERPMRTLDGEFQDILDTTLGCLVDNRFAYVETEVTFIRTDTSDKRLFLVNQLVRRGKSVDWRETHTPIRVSDSLYVYSLPIRIENAVKHHRHLRHTKLAIYLWNPDGAIGIQPISCHIRVIPTTPWPYSVLEEL
ncbi:MAG: glycosyltransferase family 39 protein [Bacteroidales bacterium]|nr:glycosyltransferase family 39 protein [Bacteroidales bacterium]